MNKDDLYSRFGVRDSTPKPMAASELKRFKRAYHRCNKRATGGRSLPARALEYPTLHTS